MRKLAAALALVFTMCLPLSVFADFSVEGSGLKDTAQTAFGENITNSENSDIGLFVGQKIIKPVIGLTGIFFFVLTVYSGVLWMTARGDDKQIGKAKAILVNSVIGVLIIASAYMITNFVINNLAPSAPGSTAAISFRQLC